MSNRFVFLLRLDGWESARVSRLIFAGIKCDCLFVTRILGGQLSGSVGVVLLESESLLVPLDEDGDATIWLVDFLA